MSQCNGTPSFLVWIDARRNWRMISKVTSTHEIVAYAKLWQKVRNQHVVSVRLLCETRFVPSQVVEEIRSKSMSWKDAKVQICNMCPEEEKKLKRDVCVLLVWNSRIQSAFHKGKEYLSKKICSMCEKRGNFFFFIESIVLSNCRTMLYRRFIYSIWIVCEWKENQSI